MIIKPLQTAEEWQWFKKRTSVLLGEDTTGVVARDDKRIHGVVVFDTFTPVAVNSHIALDTPWPSKYGLFEAVAEFAFVTAGKQRMFGLVPSNNERAIRLNRHIGYEEVARVPNTLGEGIDTVVMCIEKHNATRWLRNTEEAA